MQSINQLTDRVVSSIASGQGTTPEAVSVKNLYRVHGRMLTIPELLWERMGEIYGHRWSSAYGDTPNPGWVACLDGITPEMIKRGLARMATETKFAQWPPAALEFRSLCLPGEKELGLPTRGEAYWQATNWSRIEPDKKSPAVLLALRMIPDQYAFRRMTEKDAARTFDAAWVKVIERVALGEPLPEIPAEITDKPVKASKATAMAGVADLQAMFPKSLTTRDTTLQHDLNDRSWAEGV